MHIVSAEQLSQTLAVKVLLIKTSHYLQKFSQPISPFHNLHIYRYVSTPTPNHQQLQTMSGMLNISIHLTSLFASHTKFQPPLMTDRHQALYVSPNGIAMAHSHLNIERWKMWILTLRLGVHRFFLFWFFFLMRDKSTGFSNGVRNHSSFLHVLYILLTLSPTRNDRCINVQAILNFQ